MKYQADAYVGPGRLGQNIVVCFNDQVYTSLAERTLRNNQQHWPRSPKGSLSSLVNELLCTVVPMIWLKLCNFGGLL